MPFYFRKSVSAGPFRFNFSSGGVGVSVGVKGLRVGTGPRGHYVQAGRGGFYYRATLPRSRQDMRPRSYSESIPTPVPLAAEGMVTVRSGDVEAMEDAAFSDLLAEIRGKERQPRMGVVLGCMAAACCLLLLIVVGPAAVPATFGIVLAIAFGAWLDSYRRVAVLVYDLDDTPTGFYTRVCAAFDGLAACRAMWRLDAGRSVQDLTTWKREAGASHLVKRSRTAVTFELPSIVRCNVVPPTLKLGGRAFHFLPDVVLVRDGSGTGAVGYDALRIAHHPAYFIETDGVPSDAVVSHYTWQHPNKNGGPDRRFRNNKQIPVCRYESMHLGSESGVNELLEFSKLGVVQALADAVAAVPQNRSLGAKRLLAGPDEDAGLEVAPTERSDVGDGKLIGISAVVMAVVTGLLILVLPHDSFTSILPAAPASVAPPVDNYAFVTSPQLNCRAEAGANGAVVRRFDRADKLHIIGRDAGWAEIENDGNNCWVNERFTATNAPAAQRVVPARGHRHRRHHHATHSGPA